MKQTNPSASEPVKFTSLVEALRHRAEHESRLVAFRFLGDNIASEQTISYGELDARARLVAGELERRGAADGRALLLHPPGIDYIVALFGCFYARVTAVPAYPPSGRHIQRVTAILQDARAEWALATQKVVDLVNATVDATSNPALAALTWLATDSLQGEPQTAPDLPTITSERLALLQYTSGSTNTPKGVMVSHGNFAENISALIAAARITRTDRFCAWLPPYHDMGLVAAILLPVYLGIESVLIAPGTFVKRPGLWLEAISRFNGSVSGGPNFGYELCVRRLNAEQRKALNLRSWRCAFSGAERVNAETLERFRVAFEASGFDAKAYAPCYGLAEATLGVSFGLPGAGVQTLSFDAQALSGGQVRPASPERPSTTLVGCGPLVRDMDVRIVDPETRAQLAAGAVGEVWVRSPSVAQGYWEKPEVTQEIFRATLAGEEASGNYYMRTGDLGFFSEGHLIITGRLKDMIIMGGVNVYPEDVESALTDSHPELHGPAVAFSVDQGADERLVVVCEVSEQRSAADEDVARAVRKAVAEKLDLAVYDVKLVRGGAIPRTSSGKLQRRLSRKQYIEGQL